MLRDFLVMAGLGVLLPWLEKLLWQWAGMPAMRWWQRALLAVTTLGICTLWYGWRHGFDDLRQGPGSLPEMLGALLVGAAIFAVALVPYEGRRRTDHMQRS